MPPTFLEQNAAEDEKARSADARRMSEEAMTQRFAALISTFKESTAELIKFFTEHKPEVAVTNHPEPVTSVSTPDYEKIVDALKELGTLFPEPLDDTNIIAAIEALPGKIEASLNALESPSTIEVSNLKEIKSALAAELKPFLTAVQKLKLDPRITLPAPIVNIRPST
jgi:hypothetical protein